jgi:hypothetical protein
MIKLLSSRRDRSKHLPGVEVPSSKLRASLDKIPQKILFSITLLPSKIIIFKFFFDEYSYNTLYPQHCTDKKTV